MVERCFAWTSQTKPGPVMAFAVVNMVLRRTSMEPNDASSSFWRVGYLSRGVGTGESESQKKCVLCARLAVLKMEAKVGLRANCRTRDFVVES